MMNKHPPFAHGDAVVAPSGQIGSLSEQRANGHWSVQFGAAGPFRLYRATSLRWATEAEVKAAGMHGTGFNVRIK